VSRLVANIEVRGAIAALTAVNGQVIVVSLGVLRDDIPRVDQAGEIAERAEGDVDEGFGAAEAYFDPYCEVSVQSGVGRCAMVR
jgi:hypothetical protein